MGQLHTSSFYAIEKIDLDFQYREENQIESAKRHLEAEEQKLYQTVGTDNYEDFISKFRMLLKEENIKVLKNFEPAKLNEELARFASERGTLYNEEVQFTFDFNRMREASVKLRDNVSFKNIKNINIVSNSDNMVTLNLVYNAANVKAILNKIYKDRHFLTSSLVMDAAEQRISDLISTDDKGNNRGLQITLQNKETKNFDVSWEPPSIPNFPWGCTLSQYEDAKKNKNETILKEFEKAAKYIKDFICNELCKEATPELKTAVLWTWQKNFVAQERQPELFFQGTRGSNFISAVQGALGEFQAAVIFTFLDQQIGHRSWFAKILGDMYKRGEQAKTDVMIIKNLGLQVKNINTFKNEFEQTQLIRDLETNIHPDKLSEYMDNSEQFLDFIANYYFNTTFANETQTTYNNLIHVLNGYLGELMNFTMGQVVDTVCFYLISGKYLVPASKILEAAEELKLSNSIEITSSYRGLNDIAYELPILKNRYGKRSPLYVRYWVHPYGKSYEWMPTARNKQIYNDLISKRISIRTKFNLFKDIENFALF